MNKKISCGNCDKCKFVTKSIVKKRKIQFIEIAEKIRKDYKKEFGKFFNTNMVGSARRNLVYQKSDSKWDIDWQIYINPNIMEGLDENEIRNWFFEKFKKYGKTKFSIKNSTSAITLNLRDDDIDRFQSFDVAILKRNKKTYKTLILKMDKNNNDIVIWNEVSKYSEILKRWKEIKGSEQWTELRNKYLSKKCSNFDSKKSLALLIESLNEIFENS